MYLYIRKNQTLLSCFTEWTRTFKHGNDEFSDLGEVEKGDYDSDSPIHDNKAHYIGDRFVVYYVYVVAVLFYVYVSCTNSRDSQAVQKGALMVCAWISQKIVMAMPTNTPPPSQDSEYGAAEPPAEATITAPVSE